MPETETMARLTDYRVLTFDCYGTLIDWEDRHFKAPIHARREVSNGLARMV